MLGALQNKDQELIQRDKALRGLSLLFDPGQLHEELRPHMDTSLLGDLKLTYVRYKRGMNCLGRYEFQAEGKTHLAYLLPELGATAKKLAADLQQVAGATPAELCPVHGDFCDQQVLVGAHGLSMIDLDRRHLGAAIEDLGCFLAHQERSVIQGRGSSKGQISRSSAKFLAGYTQAGGHYDEKHLAAWTALCLFKLSHNPFKERDPDWPEQTAGLLQRAGELLRTNKQYLV